MNWLQVHIELREIPPDRIEQALLDFGAGAIEIRDAGGEPIWEPAPGTTPIWRETRVVALFDDDVNQTTLLLAIAAAVAPAPLPKVRFSVIEDQDWISAWKQDVRPTLFGPNLWVCPPDDVCPDADGIVVEMVPGMAFGTGTHPTTALCLEWLANQSCAGRTALDFGCGSGILAISAAALGAETVTAVDNDQQALTATRENAKRNGCLERLRICEPTQLAPDDDFDLIVANILSNTLVELAPLLRDRCHSGANIALSGILTDQAADVLAAYSGWIDFDPPQNRDEWIMLSGTVS
jgi:ribosomal protein L11 methyltransferase